MKNHLALILALFCSALTSAFAQPIHLHFDPTVPQVDYAGVRLAEVLKEQGYTISPGAQEGAFQIYLAIGGHLAAEAFAIQPGKQSLRVAGGDGRGLIYGALALAEQLRNGTALADIPPQQESAALPFRAIKFNLPWESYRSSSALDLHHDTARDPAFWRAFLDMMVENRFNALTLWNLHPFHYMIRAKNFPEATPFTDEELAQWRALYQAIFAMARERGIDTYLVNWNVLVSREFAEAHGLEGTNYFPYYKGQADVVGEAQTSALVKQYTRESVTQVLEEYPDLTGFGFSFGEQMGGMTPAERQAWMEETIIAGMRAADRPVKMIFRAPFSADLGQGGSTDKATEELTRDAIERLGDTFEGPIWMEIKFNWSHGHSSPELVKVHGGDLKDTYFAPTPENYRVAWMVRNEDFYALRWGVPDFIREHIRRNGHQDYVGGYFVGSENYIPAVDYFTATDQQVDWAYAFERQWLFYKLWGRLLYNPDTPDTVFEAEFVRRYGEVARPLLKSYALASSTQLKFASSVDFSWDFTLYGEGMMVFGRRGLEPLSVERLIVQPPLMPNWLSVEEFVRRRASGENIAPDTTTPLDLADRLEADNNAALDLVRNIPVADDLSLLHEVADVRVWVHLGLYHGEKLRAAVALQTYRTGGDESRKVAAVTHLENALAHWDKVVAITRPLYRDMPLAHYNPPNNQRNDDNLFHWELLRDAIARDVEVARNAIPHPRQ